MQLLTTGERTSISLTLDDVKYISEDYSLQQALVDNFFYMQRYKDKDQSSVRYLRELRDALNGKMSEELNEELLSHNRGEISIGHEYLQELVTLVDGDSINQRRLQRMLMAIKAEIAAEELVVQLRKGELSKENFTTKQIEYTERVVRLKNTSIAARNRDVHGKLHFYAFRIPRQYLEILLNTYAEKNDLSESAKQELEKQLFRSMEVNFKAVKFGQTDSARQLEILREELSHQEYEQLLLELGKQQEPPNRTGVRRKKNKKGEREPSKRVKSIIKQINMDNGGVDARIHEQLRGIIDVQVLAQIGGKVDKLLKEAKILAHAPSLDIGMLDKDFLYHLLKKEDVEFTEMVDGKGSNETVVFLDGEDLDGEDNELELNEETLKLVRDRFKESVGEYSDYLDRRNRPSVSYISFYRTANGQKKEAEVTEPTPLEEVWQSFFEIAKSLGYENNITQIQQDLQLGAAYQTSRDDEGVITHTEFSNIERAIETLKEKKGADKDELEKLPYEFAEFAPVIDNPKLMAYMIEKGGEDFIKAAVDYASDLSNTGRNNKLENLTMIYRGLKELGNEVYIEHFWNTLKVMTEESPINNVWTRLFIIANHVGYESNIEKIQEDLQLRSVYQTSRNGGVITHTHFSNIERAIETLKEKKGADKDELEKLRYEFAEFAPVIANHELMAYRIKAGKEAFIKAAVDYASDRTKGRVNTKLVNLTMIYRGLRELGDEKLIKYFWNTLKATTKESPIENGWTKLFIIANHVGYESNINKIKKDRKLGGAYKTYRNGGIITHTEFSNIERAIETLKEKKGADKDKDELEKLRYEFAEFAPVIDNPKLMADIIEKGGEDFIDKAVSYANDLSNTGGNTKLENLTMIYTGLEKLGNEEYIKYFWNTLKATTEESTTEESPIENVWIKLFIIAKHVGYEGNITKIQQDLKLGGAYKTYRNGGIITHTEFSNIERAIETLKEKKGADKDKDELEKLRYEFAEFAPVIDNPKLMADIIEKGGEDFIDKAVSYANDLSNTGGNTKLENLTMIYTGLEKLGNEEYIKYFWNTLKATTEESTTEESPIENVWIKLFIIAKHVGYEGNSTKIQENLKLGSARKTSLNRGFITPTNFSNIEGAIEILEEKGADKGELEKLLYEFAPVIDNPKLMADIIEKGGEDFIDKAVSYANDLSNTGANNKLANLTMIYRGLKELGNDDYTEYFEQQLDTQDLEKIKNRVLQ